MHMHIAMRLLSKDDARHQAPIMLEPDAVSHRNGVFPDFGGDPIRNGLGLIGNDALYSTPPSRISTSVLTQLTEASSVAIRKCMAPA